MSEWVSHPDEVDALVAEWAKKFPRYFKAEAKQQYSGRDVWALTVTDTEATDDSTPGLIVTKPHAHEPAPIAAQMNIISQLLTGETLGGRPTDLPRERILQQTVLCFMPDANPAGTAAAPVDAWDGTQYTNHEFWTWMRGIDPETGRMWKRVDIWDDTEEEPLPERYGIVYEQISPHEYVEPNRHHSSTLFQWIFELRDRRRWQRMLSLHQTEFVGSMDDAMIILPCVYDEQPSSLQEAEMQWAEGIVAAWTDLPDGHPIETIEPLKYTGQQRQYFVDRWGEVYSDTVIITSEIRNNSLLCPPALQQALNETALSATIMGMLKG
ncbi:MAG: M14 family zinc carboxypeptidase [Armatimonadota bacterium]